MEDMKMIFVSLKCPFCGSDHVGKHGTVNGKQRYICQNPECSHQTFYTDYTYNACKPGVKSDICKQSVNGSGVRAISRTLGISTDTVISALKKKRAT
jgi:transposase-like protein